MKRFATLFLTLMVCSTSLLTGCFSEEDSLQNIILVSSKHNYSQVHNGDVISLDYCCEFETTAEVVIKNDTSNEVLQHETHELKLGDGTLDITLNVGNYVGRGRIYITYNSVAENTLLSNTQRAATTHIVVEFVRNDEPRPEEDIE